MIMIMMTRKKMRSMLSFPNEQKTTAFHQLEGTFQKWKIAKLLLFLWFSSPLQIVFTLIDTTCLQQAGWNVYIDEKLRKYLSSISVSFSTFTFLMTGDNYQANVVDKTDHM